ncbi:putative mitochondrial ATPase inhibitor [Aspergillus uvarum CBS 121591]|uniref:ATPase inhibitor, mitochondrial n=1 Tax=Aspergillus uvarum CBS 121591 TaxID=1448315 RepID=A0A319DYV9_9EURO|nr:putative mitochondrial ATPase inhibitor [Aspergillus uvarum CBS 121591]PYH84082.1 putative mitochondrial ATPase inhibitor [Aspergillus uvarum CBS 121591]
MLRQSITKPLTSTVISRSFSALAPRMAAGDTGAPRAGGVQSSDSFQKREAAQEGRYIHEKELEKLQKLKASIKDQRDHLDKLDKHIDEITKEQGGEQN